MRDRPPQGAIRVAHIVYDLDAGGMESMVASLARHWQPHPEAPKMSVVTLSGRFGRVGEAIRRDAEEILAIRLVPTLSMVYPAKLARALRSLRPDVAHVHSGCWFKGVRAARMARIPRVVFTEHGRAHQESWIRTALDRYAARRTDVIVPVSADLRKLLEARGIARPDKLRVVPNGIDTNVFAPGEPSGDVIGWLGDGARRPIVGSVGRLDPVKRYDVMLRAFKILIDEWPTKDRPLLAIVGDGPENNALAQLIADLGIHPHVKLLGWSANVANILRAFTVFSLSSDSEGTSISLLEAMGVGICPVVTDVGGNRDVLGDGLAHRLVSRGDVRGLAKAWREALTDHDRRANDARAARQRVVINYSVASMADSYEAIYRGSQ